jgi:hypothetical protein
LEASLIHRHGLPYSTPRWVKVFGITVIALLLLAVGLHVIGGELLGYTFGGHGEHASPSGPTEHRT